MNRFYDYKILAVLLVLVAAWVNLPLVICVFVSMLVTTIIYDSFNNSKKLWYEKTEMDDELSDCRKDLYTTFFIILTVVLYEFARNVIELLSN